MQADLEDGRVQMPGRRSLLCRVFDVRFSLTYFVVALVMTILPQAVLSFFAIRALGLPHDNGLFVTHVRTLSEAILYIGIVSPVVETLVLVSLLEGIYKKARLSRESAGLLAALVLILLHSLQGWVKCILVGWSFLWFAWCYARLRANGTRGVPALSFVGLLHMLINLLGIAAIARS